MITLRLLIVVAMLLPSGSAVAEQTIDSPRVTASVDRTEVQIADPFELIVEVAAPRNSTVQFPEFEGRLGVFDILDVNDAPANEDDEDSQHRTWHIIYSLETLESGTLEIPSIEVSVGLPDATTKLLRTDPVQISINSLVEANADLTKFNDIASLIDVEEPEPTSSRLAWGIVAVVATLLAAAGVWAWQTRPVPYPSAQVWALAQLDSAGNEFNRLEGILRVFLAEKFHLPAESLGAVVLANELRDRKVDQTTISGVEDILNVSERVKFGGFLLSDEQKARWCDQTRSLIQRFDKKEVA